MLHNRGEKEMSSTATRPPLGLLKATSKTTWRDIRVSMWEWVSTKGRSNYILIGNSFLAPKYVVAHLILTCMEYGAFRSTWTVVQLLSVPLQSLWFFAPVLHSSWYWPMRSRVKTEKMLPLSSLRWYWKLRHPDRGTVVMGDTSLATSLKVFA